VCPRAAVHLDENIIGDKMASGCIVDEIRQTNESSEPSTETEYLMSAGRERERERERESESERIRREKPEERCRSIWWF